MHLPRPYGRFGGKIELSSEDAAAVESLARSLTNYKEASSLDALKMVRDLPSGRQAVAVDMGGAFRIIVIEPLERPEFIFDGIAQDNIPMLFSGVITKGQIKTDDKEGVKIKLTSQARKRLGKYKKEIEKKEVELQRFVIKYDNKFKYFEPEKPGIYTFTQYLKLRPTWYSGAMAQVVQIAAGYGRQDFSELPEDDIERATMAVPNKVMLEIKKQLVNVRLPAYTGFPSEEGKIVSNYGFSETDLVSFDTAGKPWLLKVSRAGVFAMPLPLVPATTVTAFHDYIEEVGDEEIQLIIDRFGGMPTGEPFPKAGAAFEAWRRAGVIIKVCDTADFYDHTSLYDACGWSMNSSGTEGFNTCYSFDGAGLMQVYGYKLKIKLGEAKEAGKLPPTFDLKDEKEARALDAYLSSIYRQVSSNSHRELAIKYKIRRAGIGMIRARMKDGSAGSGEVDYWDNLEMDPIASHSGTVARTTSGPIYFPNPYPTASSRLKFPELTGKGCFSFQMHSPDYKGGEVRCDTVVFGCYVDDQLQVIKYFTDSREFERGEESNFDDCMVVGSWEKVVTQGSSGLMGNFYTTDFDDRQEAVDTSITTKIVGKDLGYGNPAYSTPPLLVAVGGLGRSRYYYHATTTETTAGYSLDCAALVPLFDRDSIQYAFSESTSGTSESYETTRKGMADPNSYELWTYDFIFHYMGQTGNGNQGDPSPKEGELVYVDTHNYNPSACSDFADSGDWFGLGGGGFIDVSGVCAPYTSRSAKTHHAGGVTIGGEAPGFQSEFWSKKHPGKSGGYLGVSMSVAGSVRAHKDNPHPWFFGVSPVNEDFYFYRDATRIACGLSRYSSISGEDKEGLRKRWGDTKISDHKSAHYFIGVINE